VINESKEEDFFSRNEIIDIDKVAVTNIPKISQSPIHKPQDDLNNVKKVIKNNDNNIITERSSTSNKNIVIASANKF